MRRRRLARGRVVARCLLAARGVPRLTAPKPETMAASCAIVLALATLSGVWVLVLRFQRHLCQAGDGGTHKLFG